MQGGHADTFSERPVHDTIDELRRPLLGLTPSGAPLHSQADRPAESSDTTAAVGAQGHQLGMASAGLATQSAEIFPEGIPSGREVRLTPEPGSSSVAASTSQKQRHDDGAPTSEQSGHTNSTLASSCLQADRQQNASNVDPASSSIPDSAAAARHSMQSNHATLFGAITVTIANTFLGAAAMSALLIHSLGIVLSGSAGPSPHQHASHQACLRPQAALLAHFLTISLTTSSLAAILLAGFLSTSSPGLSAVALWAGGISFAGAFCATITALSFMALAQLGCTAMGWTAFGLVIGVGGALPLLFSCSLLVCHMFSAARRRRVGKLPAKARHPDQNAS